MDFKEYIVNEREFLHDISNQFVVIQANSSFLKKSFASEDDERLSEKEELKLERLNSAVSKVIAALKERKELVSQFKEFSES